jgi:two-component system sensor histidine kinase HydH
MEMHPTMRDNPDKTGIHLPARSDSAAVRVAIIAAIVLAVTILHYATKSQHLSYHDFLQRLYYLPIILGGLWFGLRGGLVTSLLITLIYIHHIYFTLGGDFWGANFPRTLELLLYNVIGVLTGLLARRLKKEEARYRDAAEALDASYRQLDRTYEKLKEQAGLLLQIEDQLRKTDRLAATGELYASLAHEIRNPLGSIKGAAEILADRFHPGDKEYEFANILRKEVTRMNDVLSGMLNFARPRDGTGDEHCRPAAVLNDVLKLVGPGLKQAGIRLTTSIDPGLPEVRFDPEQLKQTVLNIVLNAQAAMKPGGSLTVQAEQKEGVVRVTFADTGQGIPEEYLDRVFDPFFSLRDGGTGLGLAIVKRLAERFHAKVGVSSTRGRGTSFVLDLVPVRDAGKDDGENPSCR